MLYSLPDGRLIELEDVVRVSKVRDQGDDNSSIEYSRLAFAIYLRDDQIIEISEKYHFSDWSEKKKKLDLVYQDLMRKWKVVRG